MSQPFSWDFMFNPPDLHEEDGCEACHKEHYRSANYGDPSFQCCTDEINDLISDGKWCPAKPKEHGDLYMDYEIINGRLAFKKPANCLECEAEKTGGSHVDAGLSTQA